MNIKELRKLPFRKWDKAKTYKAIMVIPSGKKHDSGWALMYIIGMDNSNNPIEIAAACDDICWKVPEKIDYQLRNDMYFNGGVIRYWSNEYLFLVGASLSSTDVTLVKK